MCSEGRKISVLHYFMFYWIRNVPMPDKVFSLQSKHDSADMIAELVMHCGFKGDQYQT